MENYSDLMRCAGATVRHAGRLGGITDLRCDGSGAWF
jgi:hypothetical protein